MSFYSYFRISKPSQEKVDANQVQPRYRALRNRTFWGATLGYSIFYMCRMAFSVVKQPVIDSGFLTSSQIGIIGGALLIVYALGKFANGFIADYCNIRRFMGAGLVMSALINLILGVLGLINGISSFLIFVVFALLWGANGWAQSMGAAPGVISLSRWFPLKSRGTFYSIFCATPYLGKFLSLILTSQVILLAGWQWGFLFSAIIGLIGAVVIYIFVSDTPESKGLPSIAVLSGEEPQKTDSIPTVQLHKAVIKHPGIWIIAISSAFVYITQFGISNWGVLFLQKSKGYSLADAAFIIGIAEAVGIAGTVFSGWLSDRVFKGNRQIPVVICGLVCTLTLSAFMFSGRQYLLDIAGLSLASLTIAALYCIVAGLMALDIVPRKATGAALGIVGLSSYIAAGIQDIVSGFLIHGNSGGDPTYDFTSVAIFWIAAALLSFALPVLFWKQLKEKVA